MFSKDCHAFIINLVEYFQREKDNNGPLQPLASVRYRVAEALKISERTIQRVISEAKGQNIKKERKQKIKWKTEDLSNAEKYKIRKTIYEMKGANKSITLCNIIAELKKKDIHMKKTSLWKVTRKMGFRLAKENNEKSLFELPSMQARRVKFLREYINKKYTTNFVYVGETWVLNKDECTKISHHQSVKESDKKPISGKKYYMIRHAGTKDGFVDGASLIFTPSNKKENFGAYKNWIKTQLLPNLEEKSTIIIDNVFYPKDLTQKFPTISWSQRMLKVWLLKENITFDFDASKADLLQLCKQNQPVINHCKIDEIIRESGHQVLHLPPYHCQYNPVEMVWGICKRNYEQLIQNNKNDNNRDLDLWNQTLSSVNIETWRKCVSVTESIIEEDWATQVHLKQQPVPVFVIQKNEVSTIDE